jgi:hypothetical protein
MRRKKTSEPPVYEKGSNEITLDPPRKWSVNAFKEKQHVQTTRQKLNYCLLPDPPLFSLPSTFKGTVVGNECSEREKSRGPNPKKIRNIKLFHNLRCKFFPHRH